MSIKYTAIVIDLDCLTGAFIHPIAAWQALGMRIGIIANCSRQSVKEQLIAAQLDENIDAIIAKEDAKSYKPHPAPLIKAMQKLRSNGRNTLFISNSKSGAVMAQRIRVDFVGIPSSTLDIDDYTEVDNCTILPSDGQLMELFEPELLDI